MSLWFGVLTHSLGLTASLVNGRRPAPSHSDEQTQWVFHSDALIPVDRSPVMRSTPRTVS